MAQSAGLTMSTVWTQLALPVSPVGSVPFVGDDGLTIDIDPNNFSYYSGGQPALPGGSSKRPFQLTLEGGIRTCMDDLTGNAAVTTYNINKIIGKVLIPASQTTVRVNNTYCPAGSMVLLQLESLDATLKNVIPSIANNFFNIIGDAAATAPVRVAFYVIATF